MRKGARVPTDTTTMDRAELPGLRFELSFLAADFHEDWKRCNLVANYAAEYAAYQFPRRELAENLISTVVNEVLEAVVRVADPRSPLHVALAEDGPVIVLTVGHRLLPEREREYPAFLAECARQTGDSSLYLRLLAGPESAEAGYNQLGLAMLAHDFQAEIGFAPGEGGYSATSVRFSAKELLP